MAQSSKPTIQENPGDRFPNAPAALRANSLAGKFWRDLARRVYDRLLESGALVAIEGLDGIKYVVSAGEAGALALPAPAETTVEQTSEQKETVASVQPGAALLVGRVAGRPAERAANH